MRQSIQYLYLALLVVCCCSNSQSLKNLRDIATTTEFLKLNDPDGDKNYEELRIELRDPEDEPEINLNLTQETLKEIREKGEFGSSQCFSCPEYKGDDPNMKYQRF